MRLSWAAFSAFMVSASALVVEIVAGRMIAPYVGMSLYSWTAVIAVVLAGLSLGHLAGGRMASVEPRALGRRLGWILLATGASVLAALGLLRVVALPVLGAIEDPVLSIVALVTVLFFVPSFFAGIPSPPLVRLVLASTPAEGHGHVLGVMFAAGAGGAIAGTLLAGFLFISWIGTTGAMLAVAATFLALGSGFLLTNAATPGHRLLGIAILPAAIGAGLAGGIGRWGLAPVCDSESRYYCIRSIDITGDVGESARLLVLDHLGHGMSVKRDADIFLGSYLELIDRMAVRRFGPRFSSFFIGGGAYTLPRAWSRRGLDVTVAEIDPDVTRIARRDFWLDDGGMDIIHADARRVLAGMEARRFDVIVGDAFHDIAVPFHLVTREFAELVHRRLSPDGVYMMNVIDHANRRDALLALARTFGDVFPAVEVWADAEEFRADDRRTYVLLASRVPSGRDIVQALRTESGRRFLRVPETEIAMAAQERGSPVLTDAYAPIDRLMGPFR
jgi:MFS family permease